MTWPAVVAAASAWALVAVCPMTEAVTVIAKKACKEALGRFDVTKYGVLFLNPGQTRMRVSSHGVLG